MGSPVCRLMGSSPSEPSQGAHSALCSGVPRCGSWMLCCAAAKWAPPLGPPAPAADMTSGIVFFAMLSQQVRATAGPPGLLRAARAGPTPQAAGRRSARQAAGGPSLAPRSPRLAARRAQRRCRPPRFLASAGAAAPDPVPHDWPRVHGPVGHLQGLPHHPDHGWVAACSWPVCRCCGCCCSC